MPGGASRSMPAIFATPAARAASVLTNSANCSCVIVGGLAPSALSFSRVAGSLIACTASAARRFTISGGVAAGANNPNQPAM